MSKRRRPPPSVVAQRPSTRPRPWLPLAALAATALVYAAGLGGGFVYDDIPFVVDNPGVHVAQDSIDAWLRAMSSFPEAHQGRWLGMLSFALNYWLGGPGALGFKLVNLAIHLLNGALLYAMLRRLLALRAAARPEAAGEVPERLPIAIAAAWLLLPIQLTAVLYVSQRLESLCTSFVLLGLGGYFAARRRQIVDGTGIRPAAAWLVGATLVGAAVKESAVLLPLYAFIADWALTRFAGKDGRASQPLLGLYALVLGLPFVAGLAWLASWMFGAGTYSMSVATAPRLLTEARVMIDYLQWTLLPRLDQLALLHDDYLPSQGLLSPVSTLACILLLCGLLGLAWFARRRAPLASLGIGWFFAAHLLTGTVIPLDLVFEHRNYFASIGVLLAVASLACLLPRGRHVRTLAAAIGCLLVVNAAQVTARRAWDWGDPWRYAQTEAAHRPASSDAQYALAVAMSDAPNGMTFTQAQVDVVLLRAAALPGASIAPEATLIMGRSRTERAVDPRWWDSLVAKLRSRPPSTVDITALNGLLVCHTQGACGQPQRMLEACKAAIATGAPSADLLSNYSDFARVVLHDPAAAERALRDALVAWPDHGPARARLVAILRAENRWPEADAEMAKLRAENGFGEFDALIAQLDAMPAHR